MTREVGAVSGPLALKVVHGVAKVAYEGSDEWYTVSGGRVPQGVSEGEVARHLGAYSGSDESGNALAADLIGLAHRV